MIWHICRPASSKHHTKDSNAQLIFSRTPAVHGSAVIVQPDGFGQCAAQWLRRQYTVLWSPTSGSSIPTAYANCCAVACLACVLCLPSCTPLGMLPHA